MWKDDVCSILPLLQVMVFLNVTPFDSFIPKARCRKTQERSPGEARQIIDEGPLLLISSLPLASERRTPHHCRRKIGTAYVPDWDVNWGFISDAIVSVRYFPGRCSEQCVCDLTGMQWHCHQYDIAAGRDGPQMFWDCSPLEYLPSWCNAGTPKYAEKGTFIMTIDEGSVSCT